MKIIICFSKSLKNKIYFLFVKTYLTPTWSPKPIVKTRHQKLLIFWKTYFYSLKYENQCTLGKHISYLVIEMKTFNVPQFYNGFCCYSKYISSSFDKIIKLFTLFCLHLDIFCDCSIVSFCFTILLRIVWSTCLMFDLRFS